MNFEIIFVLLALAGMIAALIWDGLRPGMVLLTVVILFLERRRKEAFDDVYEAFVETLSSEFNQELWDSIEIEADANIKTKSFFETYEKFCKW